MTEERLGGSAGHGLSSRHYGEMDSGAVSRYGREADYTRKLTKRLCYDAAACKIHTLFRDTGYYSVADDQLHKFGARRAFEMHLNSGPKSAHGVEVLIGANASDVEKEWARDTAKVIADALGVTNRGVKVRSDLAFLHQYRDMSSILIEVVFLSNADDMRKLNRNLLKVELGMFNAYRKSIGRDPVRFVPRLTWRRARVGRYLKTV